MDGGPDPAEIVPGSHKWPWNLKGTLWALLGLGPSRGRQHRCLVEVATAGG